MFLFFHGILCDTLKKTSGKNLIIVPLKDHFNRPSRLSLRMMWICSSFSLNLLWSRRKTCNSTFCWIAQNQISLASFSHFLENSSPKDFSWQNMKKSVIWVLKFNSRYLQSPDLKKLPGRRPIFIRTTWCSGCIKPFSPNLTTLT